MVVGAATITHRCIIAIPTTCKLIVEYLQQYAIMHSLAHYYCFYVVVYWFSHLISEA